MVAETLTADRAKDKFPVAAHGDAMTLKVATGKYDVAANVEDGDIFELCKLPKDAVVVGGVFYADDLDTGTETLDLDIGWAANGSDAADPDGFGNYGVLTGDAVTGVKPETGTLLPLAGVLITGGPKKFAAETTIQAEANAAAATFAAGTISVVVYYFIDPAYE